MPGTHLKLELVDARVHRLLRDDRADDALTLADQSIRRFPRSPDAWHLLAQALMANERHPAAETAVRSGLTYDANHAGLWFTFGELARERGQLDVARFGYRRAIEIDPQAPQPWARLALVLQQQRRCPAALHACRMARRRGHPNPAELDEIVRAVRQRAAGACRGLFAPRLAAAAAMILGTAGWTVAHVASAGPFEQITTVTTTSIAPVSGPTIRRAGGGPEPGKATTVVVPAQRPAVLVSEPSARPISPNAAPAQAGPTAAAIAATRGHRPTTKAMPTIIELRPTAVGTARR